MKTKGQQKSGRIDEGEMRFKGHKNPQGWLPPCCPIGHWWQGQLYITTPLNNQINRKAPANPLTTGAGGADLRRAPGISEPKWAAGELKKRWGLAQLNNLKNIFQAAPALTGIRSNFTSPRPPIKSKSASPIPQHALNEL